MSLRTDFRFVHLFFAGEKPTIKLLFLAFVCIGLVLFNRALRLGFFRWMANLPS